MRSARNILQSGTCGARLVPLAVIEEPFTRIGMDVVSPLPRSSSGHKYILVVCDYATRYPEAIPMKAVYAEHVTEELVNMFSRVGVPSEIHGRRVRGG